MHQIEQLLHSSLQQVYPPFSKHMILELVPQLQLGGNVWQLRVASSPPVREQQEWMIITYSNALNWSNQVEIAQQTGLPLPKIAAIARDETTTLVLFVPLSGQSLRNLLAQAVAPREVSAAAVSLARFLVFLHHLDTTLLRVSEQTVETAHERLRRLDIVTRELPSPLRWLIEENLQWIDRYLASTPVLVPTFAGPRFDALWFDAGEMQGTFQWSNLALRTPGADFSGLLREIAILPPNNEPSSCL